MVAHSFFGVDDDGELVGLADSKKDSEDLSEAIKCDMDPVPEFELELHEQDGKRFMVVRIVAGNETPYYVHLKGHRDAFVRIGNESVKANATQLKRLVLKSEHRSFLNYGVNVEDFQLAATTKTITKTTTKTITKDDAIITKEDWAVLQIIRENPVVTAEEIGGKLGLTRAGAIYHINKLKTIEKIRRVGTPRNGHWEVT